jgi:hypothetical protein
MALAGAVGWFIFTRGLVESRWFPGHQVPLQTLAFFAAVMLTGGVGFQTLLEVKGGRTVGLVAIIGGAVPVMAGAVIAPISDRMIPVAAWLVGISPGSMPFYAAGTLLSIAELPPEAARAIPRAFYFWLAVGGLVTVGLIAVLWVKRRAMAGSVLAEPANRPAAVAP